MRIYWRRDGGLYHASVPDRRATVFACLDGWCFLVEYLEDGEVVRTVHGGATGERQDAMLAAERELRA